MGRDFFMARTLISSGKSGTGLRQEFEEKSEHLQDVEAGISGYDIDPNRYTNRTLENAEKAVAKAKTVRPAPRPAMRPGFHKAPARPAATTGPKP